MMASITGQKRKIDYTGPGTSTQIRKRQKGKDARAIPTQTANAALSASGELNIASFVKAREFEIAALDQSMKSARKTLSQRAFQQVPRHMRRRTASHNVKKIPRRLRGRASREMIEDNTPTGSARKHNPSSKLRLRLETAKRLQKLNENRKRARQKKKEAVKNAKEPDPANHVSVSRVPRLKKNQLTQPTQAVSKYKRRQLNKTWLPTHLWHTKRAHMTRPTLPLWRMAIPLRPIEKSYRATHRAAASRGCIACDTSYISTIGCTGTDTTLETMLKAIGFAGEGWVGSRYKKWKAGTRFAEGWAYDHGRPKSAITPIAVVWQVKSRVSLQHTLLPHLMESSNDSKSEMPSSTSRKKVKLDRRMFIRVHPSAFRQFWQELLNVAKMQKPQVLIEDLRFEIGSISIQGPGSTEALVGILEPVQGESNAHNIWGSLSGVTNPATLPRNSLLAFDVADPRLNHPPKQVKVSQDDGSIQKLNEMIVAWEPDEALPPSKIFDHKARYLASKSLPSQKAINRRKSLCLPGQTIERLHTDSKIPIMLMAQRPSNQKSSAQGAWMILIPWGCVDPIWRSLMYYPISSGSTPRFGGLEQDQQVAFEQSAPWFPRDLPGTEAGKAWEQTEAESRFDTWLRRPTSKRFSWEALDLGLGRKGELGRGWTCDWEYLFKDSTNTNHLSKIGSVTTHPKTAKSSSVRSRLLTQRQRKAANANAEKEQQDRIRRRNTSSPEPDDDCELIHNDINFIQLSPLQPSSLLGKRLAAELPDCPALATVRISLLTRGTPGPAARIYRLPVTANKELKSVAGVAEPSEESLSLQADHRESVPGQKTSPAINQTSSQRFDSIDKATLRKHWLSLDPQEIMVNHRSATKLPHFEPQEQRNRHGDPVAHRAYDTKLTKDLSHIRVFPPRETKQEVLNMFGPRPPPRSGQDILKTLQPQLVPRIIINRKGEPIEEGLWDKHVPCPDPDDLIGFATSGGYSLSEGNGVAIGALWMQRVLEGWKSEDGVLENKNNQSNDTGKSTENANDKSRYATEKKQRARQVDRQRRLCVIRNAGESVGRLGIWELC